jgi:N-acyl-phosphatidylethanolamine-hydrolysing phospholipase D
MADNLQSRVFSVIGHNENLSRPLFHKGKYGNPWDTWGGMVGFNKILKWQFTGTRPKMLTKTELDENLPVINTNWEAINNPPADQLQVTWIGHSTFLVQIDGLNFLTDPVWSDRCSPVQFAGPKRFRHVPFEIKQLPKIDFVVVSHNHYDHLDHYAVTTLQHHQKDHPPTWIVPSGLGKWFRDNLKHKLEVVELNWWDCVPLNDKVEITGTPAQHWSKRGPTDDFYTLWGSYVIHNKTTGKKVFFAGDTGYCPAFKEIGNKFGSIDLGLIPIGAYEPRYA